VRTIAALYNFVKRAQGFGVLWLSTPAPRTRAPPAILGRLDSATDRMGRGGTTGCGGPLLPATCLVGVPFSDAWPVRVRELGHEEFRLKVVEHLSVLWEARLLVWPTRRGPVPVTAVGDRPGAAQGS